MRFDSVSYDKLFPRKKEKEETIESVVPTYKPTTEKLEKKEEKVEEKEEKVEEKEEKEETENA